MERASWAPHWLPPAGSHRASVHSFCGGGGTSERRWCPPVRKSGSRVRRKKKEVGGKGVGSGRKTCTDVLRIYTDPRVSVASARAGNARARAWGKVGQHLQTVVVWAMPRRSRTVPQEREGVAQHT